MSNGSPMTSDPHERRTHHRSPVHRPSVAEHLAPDEAAVIDRLADLEDRVHTFGHRLSDTGEDLSDTLEQLVQEVVSLREQVATDSPAGPDEDSRPTGGQAVPVISGATAEMPGLVNLYGTLVQFTAGSWWEHVVRPTLRRAADRSTTASSVRSGPPAGRDLPLGSER